MAAGHGKETSSERSARLQAAGLWPAFKGCQARHLEAGENPKKAYELAAEDPRFVPGAEQTVVENDSTSVVEIDVSRWDSLPPSTFRSAVDWVAENICTGAADSEAPSLKAVSMRRWVRKGPSQENAFFTQLVPKIAADESSDDAFTDDGGVLQILEKLDEINDEVEQTCERRRIENLDAGAKAAFFAALEESGQADKWRADYVESIRNDKSLAAAARSDVRAEANRAVDGAKGAKPW